jgi:hypothetical protein
LVIEVSHDAAVHSHALRGDELGEVSDVEVLRLEVDPAEVFRGDNRGIAQVTCTLHHIAAHCITSSMQLMSIFDGMVSCLIYEEKSYSKGSQSKTERDR